MKKGKVREIVVEKCPQKRVYNKKIIHFVPLTTKLPLLQKMNTK
jgi:hypothetical protein